MNILSTLSPQLRRNLLLLFVAGLLFWSSIGLLLATLPLYVQDIGGTRQQIGIVTGSFAIGLVLSRSWLGKMADDRGRKRVLLIGLCAGAIAPLGYLLFPSIPILMALRAFHGISISSFAAYIALVVDISPPESRGELIGYMLLVQPVGMAIGPAGGSFIQESLGYPALFLVSASAALASLILMSRVREPSSPKDPKTKSQKRSSSRFWSMLNSPHIRIPALIMLMVGLAFGSLGSYLPLLVEDTGADFSAGWFYTCAAIAAFPVRLVAGRWSDRLGRGVFMTIGLTMYSLSMVILWKAGTATDFLLAGIIEGTGFGLIVPMLSAMMSDRSPANERGRVFGLCLGGFDLGIALGGPIAGLVAERWDYSSAFAFASIVSCLGILIFATRVNKNLPNSLRFALGRSRDMYALAILAASPAPYPPGRSRDRSQGD